MTVLKLEDVAVSRGAGPVISGVSLEVESGSVTAIVGPNGAGKTSLLEAISGIVRPTHGSITLDDQDVSKLTRGKRARLGIVHVEQGRTIFPSLTVRENLSLTAKTAEDFDEVLAKFPELEKRLTSPAGLLSGGEQQMVVLGRAFAAKPKILLIDEMSLGLAPVVFLRLMPIVEEIARDGVGVLLVEQFANLALKIAKDAAVVTSGHLTYSGPADALVGDPDRLKQAYLG
ncbi:ABC transporter ATP-binding protein [Gulosibacter molinativorax]|uniref:ABC transporter ATP-binding protein n=1 Tax=Gulosibacter molinativorax TaxID=256821 RepID=A0ABT7C8B6_9MICO|nr:ABC transporter ATP-binding protein [Gulosibacter molinativorax]MDJ1371009.1 ABC transporter ATP-binding protein [Gulosibacter molinativorax]QUY62803.1 Branched-chain amino acid transport system ATP-binding protein [Gulosibacter molinativorax]